MNTFLLLKSIIILFVGAISLKAHYITFPPDSIATSVENTSPPGKSLLSVINNKTNIDITFTLSKEANVKLSVYDMEGNCLAIVKEGDLNAGTQRFTWDSRNYSTGVYFAYLKADDYITTQKFLLVR